MNLYEKAFYDLMQKKPFFANLMLNCTIQLTQDKKVPTAMVGVDRKARKVKMVFNTDYLASIPEGCVMGVIEHESLHIAFSHIFMEYRFNHSIDAQVWNIATDCALNQFINSDNLHKDWITPESLEKMLGVPLERKQTAEYYYEKLKENKDKLEFVQSQDDHSGFGGPNDSDFMTPDEMKAIFKDTIEKTVQQSNGNIPKGLEGIIAQMTSNKVNWKQKFRNFVGKAVSNTTKHTRKRPNRRLGLDAPGRKKNRTVTLAFVTDSSGSVSDDAYSLFLAEAQSALKSCSTTIYHIQADMEVNDVTKYKASDKIKFERKGYGGTAYGPGLKKAVELGCDAIVYMGDMDASDVPENPGIPVVWAIVGRQDPPAKFGEIIRLDDI